MDNFVGNLTTARKNMERQIILAEVTTAYNIDDLHSPSDYLIAGILSLFIIVVALSIPLNCSNHFIFMIYCYKL